MLVGWGEWGYRGTGDAILEAIEHGRIDHYVVRPAASPDEQFHQAVSTFLLEWAEERRTAPYAIHVVGDSWAGRAYELRSVLESCAFPHAFSLADSAEGQSLLGTPPPDELPVVILPDGTTLTNPSDAELTRATGSSVEPEDTRDRPADRRRRARRAVGRRLRGLRGLSHPRGRHGRYRRAGQIELDDPQLSRVSAGHQRRAPCPACATSRRGSSAPASRSCRRVTGLRADGDRARGRPLGVRRDPCARGRPRHRRGLSPPRHPRAGGAQRRRCLLRRRRLRREPRGRPATSTCSAARTPRDRLPSPRSVRTPCDAASRARRRSRPACRGT